jgi:hypothetical protein
LSDHHGQGVIDPTAGNDEQDTPVDRAKWREIHAERQGENGAAIDLKQKLPEKEIVPCEWRPGAGVNGDAQLVGP